MRRDWVDFVHRWVRVGFGWFGSGFGHRNRLISGLRASLDASDFGGRYASGCHEVVRYRHAPCTLHDLRESRQFPHAREFRGDSELHGARHLR
jgi:hypothetical protein